MHPFTRQQLATLLAPHVAPCITLTMPVNRTPPTSTHENAVAFRNLVRQAAEQVESRFGKPDAGVSEMLARLGTLGGDMTDPGAPEAWARVAAGLAVFASRDHFSWYALPLRPPSALTVATSFHVKPLLPLLTSDERFRVLTLTRNEVALYDGDGHGLSRIPLSGVPAGLDDVVSDARADERPDQGAHGSGPMAGQTLHSYGKGSDDEKAELRKYFRAIDRAISERYSKPSGLPLIACGVEYYLPLYREVSHDPHLMAVGIPLDPVGLTPEKLHAAAWKLLEPARKERIDTALEQLGTAHARGQGALDLQETAQAAVGGRVRLLLLEEGRRELGVLDRATGRIEPTPKPGAPGEGDLLDDIAELTLATGGDVLLVPKDRMPGNGGVAAIFRY